MKMAEKIPGFRKLADGAGTGHGNPVRSRGKGRNTKPFENTDVASPALKGHCPPVPTRRTDGKTLVKQT